MVVIVAELYQTFGVQREAVPVAKLLWEKEGTRWDTPAGQLKQHLGIFKITHDVIFIFWRL